MLVVIDTSQRCYESLVENLHISDTVCLKLAISKGLGIAIVLGGAVMKVPQLLLSECGVITYM
jgi:mannose-P-dolichol utilization defect protein 1